jgi:hypothetical protein
MDIQSFDFLSSTSECLNIISTIIILIIILISPCYFIKRTGSSFSLLHKTSFLILKNFKKTLRNDLINEILEIERFNFLYHKNAISLEQKNKFENWIRKYSLDFRLITKVGKLLDMESLKLKSHKKEYAISIIVFLLFSLITLASSPILISLINKDSLLLKFENSSWFWINQYEAKQYKFLDQEKNIWVITPETCQKNIIISEDILSQEYQKIICNAFTDQDDIRYISKSIKNQKYSSIFLTTLLLIIISFSYKEMSKLDNNFKCRKMIFQKIKKYRKNRKLSSHR